MSNNTTCPLCRKTVSYQCFGKHLASKAHEEQVKELLQKGCKYALASFLKGGSTCRFDKGENTFWLCYGCKKGGHGMGAEHKAKCKSQEEHLATLRRILAVEPAVEEVGDTPVGGGDPKMVEELLKLKAENDLLKKKVSRLESEVKDLEELQETADEDNRRYSDALVKAVGTEGGMRVSDALAMMEMWDGDPKFKSLKELLGDPGDW